MTTTTTYTETDLDNDLHRRLLAAGWHWQEARRLPSGVWHHRLRPPSGTLGGRRLTRAGAEQLLATLTPAPLDAPGALSAPLQSIARRYLDARHRHGQALLDAAAALADARAAAKHGEWSLFLAATNTSSDAAERLLNIHARATADSAFAERVAGDWLSFSVAALLARPSTPDDVVAQALAAPEPPTAKAVERAIAETKIRNVADFGLGDPPTPPATAPIPLPQLPDGLAWVRQAGQIVLQTAPGSFATSVASNEAERIADLTATAHRIAAARATPPAPAGPPPAPRGWTWRDNAGLAGPDAWQLRRITDGVLTKTWTTSESAAYEADDLDRLARVPPLAAAPALSPEQQALVVRAQSYGLTAEPFGDGLLMYWPGEDPDDLLPIVWDEVSWWLDSYGPSGSPVAPPPAPVAATIPLPPFPVGDVDQLQREIAQLLASGALAATPLVAGLLRAAARYMVAAEVA